MAVKKRRRTATRARQARQLKEAAERGRALAAQVVRRRAAIRRARPVAPARLRRRRARGPEAPGAGIPARTRRALASAPPTGLLVAEGDSWFDYPLNDVLSMLEDEHGFEVEAVAHKGDTVEDMAYGEGQFDDFVRLLEKLLRRGRVPDAILLSGGGNDIAGDEFAILINHVLSGLPPVNEDIVRGVVDVRLRNAYTFLISGLTEIAQRYLDRPIPILLHGYDYAIPDGRGFLGGWAFLPGPWLQPGLRQKGYQDLGANKAIVRGLIDAFNVMLRQVSALPAFGHVKYVDLRGTLSQGPGYKADWANELHPTKDGFRTVAAKIALQI
jgi:lysophospholipase L1-like esterase